MLHLNEPVDARALGLRTAETGVPGRGVSLPGGLEVQVAVPGAQGLAAAVDDLIAVAAVPADGPAPLGTLADRVDVAELRGSDAADDVAGGDVPTAGAGGQGLAGVRLPVGVGWSTLEPIGWHLRPGEHLLVAGPARSGRTTTLCTVAAVLARLRPDWRVVAMGARHRLPSDVVTAHLEPGALPELVTLLGVRLPRRPLVVMRPRRGYLVESGSVEVVQVAMSS